MRGRMLRSISSRLFFRGETPIAFKGNGTFEPRASLRAFC